MEIFYFIPFIILLLIAVSMIVQGWMVLHEQFGYRENPKVKGHPEMKGVRKGDRLMTVKFDDLEENFDHSYNELYKRIHQQKMEELFHEPSTYEDEDEDK
jgi:ABC-type nickel/cobalt efflux system permease component RcnA